jgi:HlyD family secretion protein
LVAFPDKIFKGRIISINPTEKLIEGVVYYQVKISLEELSDEVKPGMTADLIIKTAFRENVLIIPEDAIQEKDDKTIVEILKDNIVEEKEVEIGLEGSDNMVEVVSGVLEGEKVILK